ncbi:hypothetical protein HPB47_017904 [Ixodes persulcatus]|uniref:Uncharacterized protein n=1 Tax=Ixodes persulcatus TaxID=34615 RepID=A0AC60QM40_IXOPE|nr:hypothetical protein HPB47_017904 [Ixodes persulcatus]
MYGLSPVPPPQPTPDSAPRRRGRPAATDEVWGTCGVLGFNPKAPNCGGSVITRFRENPKGARPTFRCGSCRKERDGKGLFLRIRV